MSTAKKLFIIMAVAAAFAACDKKDATGEDPDGTTTGEVETVKVVQADIPSAMQKEAEQEITAENAEQVAADLEKEIEADLQ